MFLLYLVKSWKMLMGSHGARRRDYSRTADFSALLVFCSILFYLVNVNVTCAVARVLRSFASSACQARVMGTGGTFWSGLAT